MLKEDRILDENRQMAYENRGGDRKTNKNSRIGRAESIYHPI